MHDPTDLRQTHSGEGLSLHATASFDLKGKIMRNGFIRLLIAASLTSIGIWIVPSVAQGAAPYVSASIIPANTFAIGNSIPYGVDGRSFGYALTANGIDGGYTPEKTPSTYEFVVFFFANIESKYDMKFTIVSPSHSIIYSYNFSNLKIESYGTWGYVNAKATFARAGTYLAEVHYGKTLIGSMPMNFT